MYDGPEATAPQVIKDKDIADTTVWIEKMGITQDSTMYLVDGCHGKRLSETPFTIPTNIEQLLALQASLA
jgi:hypothetical protein